MIRFINKNDHRSGEGAVREVALKSNKANNKTEKKKNCLLFNICVNCAIRRIKGLSSIVN